MKKLNITIAKNNRRSGKKILLDKLTLRSKGEKVVTAKIHRVYVH